MKVGSRAFQPYHSVKCCFVCIMVLLKVKTEKSSGQWFSNVVGAPVQTLNLLRPC